MNLHQYFKTLSHIETLITLPRKFKYFQHNLPPHSFKLTKIPQYLPTLQEYHPPNINSKTLYQKPLNHHFPQLFTPHIKTPLKYPTTQLKKLFSQLQE
ncbi:YfbR-like 5'-deoxynucleotidase, partial [Staphylococcus aureus]|uniref:YfbR-like 5'-deoxynucleotidase n=1 Tax=Staphylococcus aureus TaxID=1280 RepID=UPI0028CBACF2